MSKLDGTDFRELLPFANDGSDLKALLAGLTEGLTAEDLHRARDFGRDDPEWAPDRYLYWTHRGKDA